MVQDLSVMAGNHSFTAKMNYARKQGAISNAPGPSLPKIK